MEITPPRRWPDVMANKADKNTLADQRIALKSYLEQLLLEVEEYSPAQERTSPALSPSNPTPPAASQQTQESGGQSTAHQNMAYDALDTQASADKDEAGTATEAPLPTWAEFPFQALTFEIANALYAVPLKDLNGIVPMPQRLTQVPTDIAWFVGLFRNRDINVKVIDVEKLWQPAKQTGSRENQVILLIDEGRFGFVVDKVKTIIKLGADDVQWRHSPALQGVLCGSIRTNMATLIDLQALKQGLHAGIWAGPRRKSV